jgi:hypothetical protein
MVHIGGSLLKQGCIHNGVEVENEIGQTSNEEVNITHLPGIVCIHNVSVKCVEIQDISN